MTYLSFLGIFLFVPIIVLFAILIYDRRKAADSLKYRGQLPVGLSFLILVLIALVYTTPWDNYLVATKVWWYDPALVLGITFGWVPFEEYLFFILQPILVGLWMLVLISRVNLVRPGSNSKFNFRRFSVISVASIWIISLMLLLAGGSSANYLGLELAWALPPLILQLVFGADILWDQRRLIFLSVVPLTLYLSLADAIAIQTGIWTISSSHSTGILLGGLLPLEEFVFFFLTNSLVAFGFALIWSPKSYVRIKSMWTMIRPRSQVAPLEKQL
jgi:lycopene cyclase domain-containing protein